jgi:predicted phosphodiesterase
MKFGTLETFGDLKITDKLGEIAPLKGVYGNIDNDKIRQEFPLNQYIEFGNHKVLMTHIGGKPYNYYKNCKQEIEKFKPTIFVCGHSHICKVIYDKKYNMLYINPGAAGIVGFHKVRTIIRFELPLGNHKEFGSNRIKEKKRFT